MNFVIHRPTPSVLWTKTDEVLAGDRYEMRDFNRTLYIPTVTYDDAGTYTWVKLAIIVIIIITQCINSRHFQLDINFRFVYDINNMQNATDRSFTLFDCWNLLWNELNKKWKAKWNACLFHAFSTSVTYIRLSKNKIN